MSDFPLAPTAFKTSQTALVLYSLSENESKTTIFSEINLLESADYKAKRLTFLLRT